jgi:hypothetical protein
MVAVTSIVARKSIDICDESFYLHRQMTRQTANAACNPTAGQRAIPARLTYNPSYARSKVAATSVTRTPAIRVQPPPRHLFGDEAEDVVRTAKTRG